MFGALKQSLFLLNTILNSSFGERFWGMNFDVVVLNVFAVLNFISEFHIFKFGKEAKGEFIQESNFRLIFDLIDLWVFSFLMTVFVEIDFSLFSEFIHKTWLGYIKVLRGFLTVFP